MARAVHEDKGDSEDDNDIVVQGQQCRRRHRVVGHPTQRTRVRAMARVWRART